MSASEFHVGDHVEMQNPHFPEKRPSRHVVTKLVPGAGEFGDRIMLELDHSMGAPPEWCSKARIVYPSTDRRDAAALVHALDNLNQIIELSDKAKAKGGSRQTPHVPRRLVANCKVSVALLMDTLAGIPEQPEHQATTE